MGQQCQCCAAHENAAADILTDFTRIHVQAVNADQVSIPRPYLDVA